MIVERLLVIRIGGFLGVVTMKPLYLSLMLVALTSSCKSEDYEQGQEFFLGEDEFCSQAQGLHQCHELADRCQPAYRPVGPGSLELEYDTCISNPDTYSNTRAPQVGERPTLALAIKYDCKKLDSQDMLIKKISKMGLKSGEKKEDLLWKKVKICHKNAKGIPHSMVLPCSHLKGHVSEQHAQDHIGACEI